jgi:hypothetical protein
LPAQRGAVTSQVPDGTPYVLRCELILPATFLPEIFDPFLKFLPGFFDECPGSSWHDTISEEGVITRFWALKY